MLFLVYWSIYLINMQVTFIGTGCGVPSTKRMPSSITIKINNKLLWIDTGPGTLRKLLDTGVTYKDVDYILYTHFHLDHIADFGPFIFASKYQLDLREKPLTVLGPIGIKEFYKNLINLYGEQIQKLAYDINIIELPGDRFPKEVFNTPDFGIQVNHLLHMPESIGYRITDKNGKTLVYSGDTEYCEEIIELAKDTDLLILECAFPEPTPVHLYPEAVGDIAAKAGIKQLAVTHMYPVCNPEEVLESVKSKFPGKIIIPDDLMKIEL